MKTKKSLNDMDMSKEEKDIFTLGQLGMFKITKEAMEENMSHEEFIKKYGEHNLVRINPDEI